MHPFFRVVPSLLLLTVYLASAAPRSEVPNKDASSAAKADPPSAPRSEPPSVAEVLPSTGPALEAQAVTLRGTGFKPKELKEVHVRLLGPYGLSTQEIVVLEKDVLSDTVLTFGLPKELLPKQSYRFIVSTISKSRETLTGAPSTATYVPSYRPVVKEVLRESAGRYPQIQISGANFDVATKEPPIIEVKQGSETIACDNVAILSPMIMTCTLPPGLDKKNSLDFTVKIANLTSEPYRYEQK